MAASRLSKMPTKGLISTLLARPNASEVRSARSSFALFRSAASSFGSSIPQPLETKPLQWRDIEKDWYKRVCPYFLPHAYGEEDKETINLPGCDFKHWLVVVNGVSECYPRYPVIHSYIKTLAKVVGSYEEARMKIYSASTCCYFAFGALVSEELATKLRELPEVDWVFPDSYANVEEKTYGGEPFINGQPVQGDHLEYYDEWFLNYVELSSEEMRRSHLRMMRSLRRKRADNNNNAKAP